MRINPTSSGNATNPKRVIAKGPKSKYAQGKKAGAANATRGIVGRSDGKPVKPKKTPSYDAGYRAGLAAYRKNASKPK